MKCSFCGKELAEGAEFCPECGMILSIGGVSDEPEEKQEVPEYTPNVFKGMDFEEEPDVPAMELEVADTEETAVVVEAIPEFTEEPDAEEEAGEEVSQEEPQEEEPKEIFEAPEYDPTAKVSDEFMQQSTEEDAEAEAEAAAEEAVAEEAVNEEAEEIEETAEAAAPSYAEHEDEFEPPEYNGNGFEVTLPEDEVIEEEEAAEEYISEDAAQAYPVYNEESDENIPEEQFTEDEGLFAALFEDDESEKIEDITPADTKPEKAPKKSFAGIAVLLIILVGVVIAGGYVFKNVLPKIVDTSNTTTAATDEKVDATVESEEKTTKDDKTTTEKTTTEKTTTDKVTTTEGTTEESTTEEPATEKTTSEKETTTKAPEKTTEPSTESAEPVVILPSSYNVDEVPFFPISGDITIKAGPSASSADMMIHPYGYPVYAYAKEGSYYYVDSPILDFMGWVNEADIEEYVEAPVEDTTAAYEPEEEPEEDTDTSYTAIISSADGLNFRTGPGSDYEIKYTVPGGYRVRVTKESADNPGWVYVTIEDDSYPYGSPSGWVSSEFLS